MPHFIDSSAFFAWTDEKSPEGSQIEATLAQTRSPLITSNLVFAETISLITKRIGKFKGRELGEKIRKSRTIQVARITEAEENEAWKMYLRYADKDFDFIDATSFVFCKKNGIKEVFTLDHHFAQMGFKVQP
ncbi:MAG: PIN domain-containing protein [Deltaproteobacteria bacterium]|nr:PIN domain-containing protein [Deltaproteobacteria bacterium]